MNIPALVHSSALPHFWRADYLESFASRRMNHRFHYESPKQATRWLALHEAYSPARNDKAVRAMYAEAFRAVAKRLAGARVQIASFGCGGGQKDFELLRQLKGNGCVASYVPSDLSLPLALTAHLRAQEFENTPLILDLGHAENLAEALPQTDAARIFALFGIVPNFDPDHLFALVGKSLDEGNLLLLGANLAPGADYAGGVQRVLPGYDNALTRAWLNTALTDAGIEAMPEDINFEVKTLNGLKRIEASHTFRQPEQVRVEGESFEFEAGEIFRLFFSYRYTSASLREWLGRFGMRVVEEWVAPSGEEGVFLCGRAA